ncbi:MAG TPA: hypothetical protein VGX96_11630 [Candidatus Elarobacter sp.]|jgi:hypothetical protein|nr:hypothetical protein [Candidatus Elarobacter sp.]
MRHQPSITINGQSRDEVVLSAGEPLAGVVNLTLEFDRQPQSDGIRILQMTAGASDYFDGAYHFRRWHSWPSTAIGAYRARGVTLRFSGGGAVEAPLSDEIIVDVRPAAADELPFFSAR